jgi:FixJ family two-component response regulator
MAFDKRQIFIVDDDESVCRALKLLMMTYGFVVDVFSSAEIFFSAIPNSAPGCLILDIHLPGINGWDAKKRLRESGSDRSVIMITADKEEGLTERAFKAGAIGLLQKPFRDLELVNLINRAF